MFRGEDFKQMKVSNGSRVLANQMLGGAIEDDNGKPVEFEKDGTASFTGTGSDGKTYSFTLENALVTVLVADAPDKKEMRKRSIPLPKNEIAKLDKEIKEDEERAAKAREAAATPGATTTTTTAKNQEPAEGILVEPETRSTKTGRPKS
jgi:hypothetical protein